eukprot:CAMPEP_0113878316 /NCGR_PEP_ID=MMETSP0780_2-20120614/6607_1 /TAXON_ID=652834 /ORGANISM="Palpitomonas bilix" /LENGTH=560 /DNA_ID=CAMNT_0000864757 /DNA_START=274 /DNA_END=1961 /DNA_ORIENTATION=+ /assembly_acc=CAM_ASM_000599
MAAAAPDEPAPPVAPATPLSKRGARSVDAYEIIESIGEGTFGQVSLARDRETKEKVALKRVKMTNEKEGFPITAIREIKILKMLDHENVLNLREIVTSRPTDYNRGRGSVFMVFDYIEHDLAGLIEKYTLDLPTIKCYIKQLLEGLHYCHKSNVLHRDIKSANLLIGNDGILRLADFGLARNFRDGQQLTTNVVTLWYRAPELLFGFQTYGAAIDVWAVGCTLAEALLRRPLFTGKTEIEMIQKICSICGTPTATSWPDVGTDRDKLARMKLKMMPDKLKETLQRYNSQLDSNTIDLLSKMLTMNPKKPNKLNDALFHEFFWTKPMPLAPCEVRKYEGEFHEWQVKKARRKQQARHAPPAQAPPPQQQHPQHAQHPQHRHHQQQPPPPQQQAQQQPSHHHHHQGGRAEDGRPAKRQAVEGQQGRPQQVSNSHNTLITLITLITLTLTLTLILTLTLTLTRTVSTLTRTVTSDQVRMRITSLVNGRAPIMVHNKSSLAFSEVSGRTVVEMGTALLKWGGIKEGCTTPLHLVQTANIMMNGGEAGGKRLLRRCGGLETRVNG